MFGSTLRKSAIHARKADLLVLGLSRSWRCLTSLACRPTTVAHETLLDSCGEVELELAVLPF
jgi:hypothetical protein